LPTVATIAPKITVEEIDTDYFVTFDHPMTKDHYLSFAAYVKSDRVFLIACTQNKVQLVGFL